MVLVSSAVPRSQATSPRLPDPPLDYTASFDPPTLPIYVRSFLLRPHTHRYVHGNLLCGTVDEVGGCSCGSRVVLVAPCEDVVAGARAIERFIGLRRIVVPIIGTKEKDGERRRERRDRRTHQYAISFEEPLELNSAIMEGTKSYGVWFDWNVPIHRTNKV
jgi:hypothetical protein